MTVIFVRINFRLATVNRFRAYSKKLGETHSDTLDAMLHFFEHYKIHPFGELASDLNGLELNIKKRINAMIAILKDIEKHQIKPTTAMMQLLFEGTPPKEKQPELLLEETTDMENEKDFFGSVYAIQLREEKNTLKQKLETMEQSFEEILYGKIEIVTPSFGKERIKLNLTVDDYRALKQQFKNKS